MILILPHLTRVSKSVIVTHKGELSSLNTITIGVAVSLQTGFVEHPVQVR